MTASMNQPLAFAIRVDSAYQTDVGKKKPNNEDYAVFYEPENPDDLKYSGCLYIVADGVGGARKGEKASKYAADKVLYEYYQQPEEPPAERLENIFRNVGNEILDYSGQTGLGKMATTMVAAVVRGDRLLIANVGDSRAYLIRNGSVQLLTRDHNQLSELLRSGALTPEEGRRSKVGNILTRSIGGHEDVDVDVFPERQLQPGDLLILCSDGLHRYLTDEVLLSLVHTGTSQEIAQRLIRFANDSGGADNISALVVSIQTQENEYLPRSTGPLPKPPSLDQMPTEVKFAHPTSRKKIAFRSEYLLLAAPLAMIVVLVIFWGNQIRNVLPGNTTQLSPTFTSLPINTDGVSAFNESAGTTTPEPTHAPAFTSDSGLLVENTPTLQDYPPFQQEPTWTADSFPTENIGDNPPSGTAFPGTCVYLTKGGDTISKILGSYDKEVLPNKEYFYFTNCDMTNKECFESSIEQYADVNTIDVNQYFWVEEVLDIETCTIHGGVWVQKK